MEEGLSRNMDVEKEEIEFKLLSNFLSAQITHIEGVNLLQFSP